MEMLKESLSQELHVLRTNLEIFLETYLTSDSNFAIAASPMEDLKIQHIDWTLIGIWLVWRYD
jgi:hypothetical protein